MDIMSLFTYLEEPMETQIECSVSAIQQSYKHLLMVCFSSCVLIIIQCVSIISGFYHHFDAMVLPSKSLITKSMREKFMSRIRGIWGKKEDTINLQAPEYHEMLQKCLMFYLDSYRGIILTAQFSSTRSIATVVKEINEVFVCLLESCFTYGGGPRVRSFKPDHIKKLLQEVCALVKQGANFILCLCVHLDHGQFSTFCYSSCYKWSNRTFNKFH